MSRSAPVARLRLRIFGVVQGVGFRPFVYTLANRHGLTGFVGNDSQGVFVEAQGPLDRLEAFQRGLLDEAPSLAHVERILTKSIAPREERTFVIVESEAIPGAATSVSPDVATCEDCLRELFDPGDRRYRYPFINCTHCGPRFTIIRDLPYDRPMTTMAAFPMCPDCVAEYHDPASRRFHAQPNACARCGPELHFVGAEGSAARGEDALSLTVAALDRGEIVAVKGIGGFHLACDAAQDRAVARLRERKGRTDKPFAVLVANVEQARRRAFVDDEEARLLTSKERPIVLVRRRPEADVSPLVAPGTDRLGLLLPYSPLHHLLVDRPLVFTSANLGDEPIVKDNDEVKNRLSSLADAFLFHNRDIHVVCDDSVVCRLDEREYPIRRSRGHAPLPIPLPRSIPAILAVGAELKSTFCLTRGDHAYLSQHVGDLANLETLRAFEQAVHHFEKLFRNSPSIVVRDGHPDYLSSRWAEQFARQRGIPLVEVQHHHAHLAALFAERGGDGSRPILGFCLDGTGYGTDGAIWGGEFLLADYDSAQRLAHLRYVPMPGGDAAIRKPYRAALAHLRAAGLPWDDDLPCVQACSATERRVLDRQLGGNVNCVPTSSMGRLFDAVASLLGLRQVVTYEAQAAIEMECLADESIDDGYEFGFDEATGLIEPAEVLRSIIEDKRAGVAIGVIVSRFFVALAEMMVRLATRARGQTGIHTIGLTGGVFQNLRLTRLVSRRLREANFEVWTHHHVPTNDGGICLGQAAIVGLRRQVSEPRAT